MAAAGTFRWDLLYRLNTITLEVPPLRERPDEVAPLARRFLTEAASAGGSPVRAIDPEALAALERYGWPGNVRELRNAIERAVALAQGDRIGLDDLSERIRGGAPPVPAAGSSPPEPVPAADPAADFRTRVKSYEVDLILDALRRTGGNQTEAARLLRMPVRTLAHKIQLYGLKKRFEPGE
jgi:DNA-binding NtrC family response regulator